MSGDLQGAHSGRVIPLPVQSHSTARCPSSFDEDARAERTAAHRTELRRSVWLRESGMIAAGYLADGVLVGTFAAAGAVHWSAVLLCTVPGWITCSVASILIARGHSRHWKDPAVSNAQAFAGMAICLGGIVLYPEISFLYVLSLAVIFLGATYRMSRACIQLSWASACALIGLIMFWGDRPLQVPQGTTTEQLISGACAAVTLARTVLFSMINRGRQALLRQREQQLADALAQVQQLAELDELTGLPNRRSMLRTLDDELDRCARDGAPLSVARLSVNHLKTINKTRGHLAGDRTLEAFAAAVQAHLHDKHSFGRLGGAQFLLILSATSIDDALDAVEQLRQALTATNRNATAPQHFSFSAGVGTWQEGETAAQLLNRADSALDGALHAGRDCFRVG